MKKSFISIFSLILQTFQKEIEYWKEYTLQLNTCSCEMKIIFDNAYLFNYPTAIAWYYYKNYTYMSIIEEQNRIIYVVLSVSDANTTPIIPEEFLPKNYHKNVGKNRDGYELSILFCPKDIKYNGSWYGEITYFCDAPIPSISA